MQISWKYFPKIRKLLNFRSLNHSTREKKRKFRDENQMERKFPVGNFQKLAYTGCPLEIPENAVPFAKFQSGIFDRLVILNSISILP